MKVEQKYQRVGNGNPASNDWILGESGGDSYLASQCRGNSGLEKDLRDGWLVKAIWEDKYQIVFLL